MPTKPTFLTTITERAAKGSALNTTENDDNIQAIKDGYAPIGSIVLFPLPESFIPDDYLPCDGRAISRSAPYDDLFNVLGTYYGSGNGSTTFNLPDMRGLVPRMVTTTTEGSRSDGYEDPNESSRVITGLTGATTADPGSIQLDDIKEHAHPETRLSGSAPLINFDVFGGNVDAGRVDSGLFGNDETRMKNIYMIYMIKARGGL